MRKRLARFGSDLVVGACTLALIGIAAIVRQRHTH